MTSARLPTLHGGFVLKLGLTLALIALGDALFFQRELYAGWFGIYGFAMLAALLAARPAVRGDLRALTATAIAALYCMAMVWDASPLPFLLFWVAAGLATLLPGIARFDDGWRWLQRLVVHGFFAAFGPLIDLFKLHRARRRRPQRPVSLRGSASTLILPLWGTAVFFALFATANPVIEAFLSSLALPSLTTRMVVRMILWGLLFVLAWGVLRPRQTRHFLPVLSQNAAEPLPGVTPASVLLSLVLFNLLFALQNAMDLAWLWGLMPLPAGTTLADYAHRGAYPLIATALLAALFVLVTLRPGSATAEVPAIRKLVVLWIAQNLVLVASSMLRTLDYVDAYSLTKLRIAALAWMVLVGIGLVLIVWRLLKAHSGAWLINANLTAAALLLTAFAFVDTGAIAAQWNVRHAREVDGTGAGLDLCYLNQLDGSALLALIELERRTLPPELHERVVRVRQGALSDLRGEIAGGGWTWLAQRRLEQAERMLGKAALPGKIDYRLHCDGSPYQPKPAEPALTGAAEQ